MNTDTGLTIALSRGRILQESLPVLACAGIRPRQDPLTTRKLVLDTEVKGIRLMIVRAADVPTYVEYGAADVGIAGKDVLMEYNGAGLYEPLDLGIARCRMVLAGPVRQKPVSGRLRVATKYVNSTRDYFARGGEQVEIIKLYGSMELAPLLGLADRIVDLMDTGRTLKVNGLAPLATIAEISSRVIVNKAAMKMKHEPVQSLLHRLAQWKK